jgi:hypothetical protein
MYCSACATPVAPGLSYCNRCGMSLKTRSESKTGAIAAFLTAITLIGIAGMGIMLGGTLALKKEANLGADELGLFMVFTFCIVVLVEIFLVRQLSRFSSGDKKKDVTPQYPVMPYELPAAQPRTLAEPISSVTENTTRTLDYSRNEPLRQRTMGQKIEEEP